MTSSPHSLADIPVRPKRKRGGIFGRTSKGRPKGAKTHIRTDMTLPQSVHDQMVKDAKILGVAQVQYQRQALANLTRMYAENPPTMPPEECATCHRKFQYVTRAKAKGDRARLTTNLDGDSLKCLLWLAENFFYRNASAAMEKALTEYGSAG